MATGVTAKERNTKKKNPFFITYEGKIDSSVILNESYIQSSKIIDINGNGTNQFFFGDNIDTLHSLIDNGYKEKISLIYIDPPFATASDFVNRQQEHAYSDTLCGADFIEFLRQRLILMKELLASNGSIYLHLDNKMAFAMKIVMDEIFGGNNCRAFITRKKCSTKNYTKNTYGNVSDYIMFYSKTDNYIWNRPFDSWELNKMIEQYPCVDENGQRYKKVPVHAPGTRNGETGKPWRGKMPPKGKHWQYTPEKLDELDAAGEIYWSPTGNPRRKVFCDPTKGIPIQDIWLNYRDSVNQAQKTTGYPTEKNYEMLKMIIAASSNEGDIVMDCFAGSGTTLGAAHELGRVWIGADSSIESIKAVLKRFTTGLDLYGDYVNDNTNTQLEFDFGEKCKFSIFSTEQDSDKIIEIYKELFD